MSGERHERDDFDEFEGGAYCYRCDNSGFVMICPDDVCQGAGECMHGDGEILCPACGGRNAN